MSDNTEISAIVPVVKLLDTTGRLTRQYLDVLESTGRSFELVYVLDGEHEEFLEHLWAVAQSEPRLRVIQLAKNFGEASALTAGFESTKSPLVLTLPAYAQVEPDAIPAVLERLRDCDVAIATRAPNQSNPSRFKAARRRIFHWLVRIATGQTFSDVGCGVRALKREVVDELPLYGDQYRFIPLLATRRGFKVCEVPVREVEQGRIYDHHGVSAYLARLLDIFGIVFLTRFTKKPLRFFGAIGSTIFAIGALLLAWLAVQRLFFDVALADRPALLLTSLMVVLGMQVFALGLLGELIIFAHARDIKEYSIERIVN